MGYYTGVVVWYKEKRYSCCERDGFENWCEEAIKLIIDEFMIYKDYIKNILKFLNVDRSKNVNADFWPKWRDYIKDDESSNDQNYYIYIYYFDKIVQYSSHDTEMKFINITNQRNPQNQKFIDFINRRFLLKNICEKYAVPKDIHSYLVNFFFKN